MWPLKLEGISDNTVLMLDRIHVLKHAHLQRFKITIPFAIYVSSIIYIYIEGHHNHMNVYFIRFTEDERGVT